MVHRRSAARFAPFPSDVFCVGLTSCGYGPPRQRRRYNIGKGELPSKRAIFSQPTFQNNIKYPINVLSLRLSNAPLTCQNTDSFHASHVPATELQVQRHLPHLPTTKNVKMKIHAPKTKHSKDSGDTCDSSASKKAQVYDPTLLSQAGATSIDVTWRKTFSQGA